MTQDENDKFLHLRVSARFLSRLDDWRTKLRPVPTRSEAVRLLVDLGIDAGEGKK